MYLGSASEHCSPVPGGVLRSAVHLYLEESSGALFIGPEMANWINVEDILDALVTIKNHLVSNSWW